MAAGVKRTEYIPIGWSVIPQRENVLHLARSVGLRLRLSTCSVCFGFFFFLELEVKKKPTHKPNFPQFPSPPHCSLLAGDLFAGLPGRE